MLLCITNSSIWLIDRTLSGATTPEWTWEQWQWRGTPHSPKFQLYWNLAIRLFSIIYQDTRWGEGRSYPSAEMQLGVFYNPSWLVFTEEDHQNDWWIDFNSMSIHLELFHSKGLMKQTHCMFIFTFFYFCFLSSCFLFIRQLCSLSLF